MGVECHRRVNALNFDDSISFASEKLPRILIAFVHPGVGLLRRNVNSASHRPLSSIASVSPDGSISSQEHSLHHNTRTLGSNLPTSQDVSSFNRLSFFPPSTRPTTRFSLQDDQASSRHSVTSNNSSNLSSPPSPAVPLKQDNNMDADKGSSSYDS